MSENNQSIVVVGEVLEALPNTTFRVEVEGQEKPLLAYLSGKMRKFRIKIVIGDKVEVVTDKTMEKGRISRRL
ncbi:MAG: translation initiation factor IF-1 [Bacteroidetes bacterium]|nr:translation initiation factor IF-1 [Bacteroidota bacterium]